MYYPLIFSDKKGPEHVECFLPSRPAELKYDNRAKKCSIYGMRVAKVKMTTILILQLVVWFFQWEPGRDARTILPRIYELDIYNDYYANITKYEKRIKQKVNNNLFTKVIVRVLGGVISVFNKNLFLFDGICIPGFRGLAFENYLLSDW
jgi:hypothetical protein